MTIGNYGPLFFALLLVIWFRVPALRPWFTRIGSALVWAMGFTFLGALGFMWYSTRQYPALTPYAIETTVGAVVTVGYFWSRGRKP